jgi:TonB family protein
MPKMVPNRLRRFFQRRPLCVAGLLLALFGLCFLQASAAEDPTRKVIVKTAPSYPELARRMHLAGKVKLQVVIAANGTVKSAALVGGNPVFEKSAVEAMKQWRFESAPSDTKAVIVLEFAEQ